MAYTIRTTTTTLPVTYMWKCSKCGATNQRSSKIRKVWSDYFVGRAAGRAKSGTTISNPMAKLGLDLDLMDLAKGYASAASYRGMAINGRCKKCGNKEPWSFPSIGGINRFIQNTSPFLLPLTSICFVVSLFFHGEKEGFLPAIILGLLVAIMVTAMFFGYHIDNVLGKSMQKKLDIIPDESFPILVVDGRPLRRIKKGPTASESKNPTSPDKARQEASPPASPDKVKQEASKSPTPDDKKTPMSGSSAYPTLRCRNCGRAIPHDSKFCQYCGEKTNTSQKVVSSEDGWLASLSCSVLLCVLDESRFIRESGANASLVQLNEGEYFCPVLSIRNLGHETPQFSVSCIIDGGPTKPWKECSMKSGQTTTFILSENNAILHMLVGEHTITYRVKDHELLSFSWSIHE